MKYAVLYYYLWSRCIIYVMIYLIWADIYPRWHSGTAGSITSQLQGPLFDPAHI